MNKELKPREWKQYSIVNEDDFEFLKELHNFSIKNAL